MPQIHCRAAHKRLIEALKRNNNYLHHSSQHMLDGDKSDHQCCRARNRDPEDIDGVNYQQTEDNRRHYHNNAHPDNWCS